MEKEILNDYVFGYNPYIDKWMCCLREHYVEMHNNHNSPNVLKSDKVDTLVSLITKYKSIPNIKKNVK